MNETFERAKALHKSDRLEEAIALYREASQLAPDSVDVVNMLGNALFDAGRFDQAIEAYRRALELDAEFAAGHFNLGNALCGADRREEAVTAYRQALELRPSSTAILFNLGNTLYDLGQLGEAEACYRQALSIRRKFPEANFNLGNVLFDSGRFTAAVQCYRAALKTDPGFLPAISNLGRVYLGMGRLRDAERMYREAIKMAPDRANEYFNLANVLYRQDNRDAALACYERAVELDPDHAEALYDLGNVYHDRGRLEDALSCYDGAAEIRPDFGAALNNRASVLREQGRLDEALAAFRQAVEVAARTPAVHSNLLLAMAYSPSVSGERLREEASSWATRHAAKLPRLPTPENSRDPARCLRVAYLSADLRQHPVGSFLESVLASHDRSQVEVYCYATCPARDELTKRLQSLADSWTKVTGETDEALAQRIRDDHIDILVDLSGHTADHRLLVLARRPAPIQATWLGYPATTGVCEVDYIIADPYVIPPGDERFYVERPVRLPGSYVCFKPPEHSPPVAPSPARSCGAITFGCCNNNAKITPDVIRLWAQILNAVPGSRLLLKSPAFASPAVAERYRSLFSQEGVDSGRLRIAGYSMREEVLAAYNEVDIALDPFPYNGGMTTLEALWMSVPVVALRGDRFAARVGDSLLSNAGLSELVANSPEDYVKKAVELAINDDRLDQLRGTLRRQLAESPLCDADRFTRHLEEAYREMWSTWCEQGG